MPFLSLSRGPTPDPEQVLARTDHRPFPLPDHPWVMAQTLHHALFAHWALPPGAVRPLLPQKVTLDTYDGQAWVGIVPFKVTGARARYTPALPLISTFSEVNVRTYVTAEDKPGVWFFSLDASQRLFVELARLGFRLPWFNARIRITSAGDTVSIASERKDRRAAPGCFRARYWPTSAVFEAEPGTLDHWLTERYCAYTTAAGALLRTHIHHHPWPLQKAGAEIDENTVANTSRIYLPEVEPVLHYARRHDMLTWYLEPV